MQEPNQSSLRTPRHTKEFHHNPKWFALCALCEYVRVRKTSNHCHRVNLNVSISLQGSSCTARHATTAATCQLAIKLRYLSLCSKSLTAGNFARQCIENAFVECEHEHAGGRQRSILAQGDLLEKCRKILNKFYCDCCCCCCCCYCCCCCDYA